MNFKRLQFLKAGSNCKTQETETHQLHEKHIAYFLAQVKFPTLILDLAMKLKEHTIS